MQAGNTASTGSRMSEQASPEEHLASDGCYTSCSDSGGETEGPSQDDKAKQCSEDGITCLSTITPPEGKCRRTVFNQPAISPERLKTAKAIVEKSVKMHKIFSIRGPYPVIRAALRARGWVEQRMRRTKHHMQWHHSNDSRDRSREAGDSDEEDDSDDDDDLGDAEKKQGAEDLHDIMSRLVRNEMVYFYWTRSRYTMSINLLQKEQIINHFPRAASFTTKAGLCVNLRKLHWFDSADPDTLFPRCYRLGAVDEKQAFIEDYRRTVCTSLLKYIVESQGAAKRGGTCDHIHAGLRKRYKRQERPMIISQMIDRAIRVCQEFLDSLDHADIDKSLETQLLGEEKEWAEFIDNYYCVVHGAVQIRISDHCLARCKDMLQRLRRVSPQLEIDGIHNIWIIKPGAKSRGRGIKCARHLDQILSQVHGDPTLMTDSKWVVQKYLERPLLVHGTKFDVRQWFLVTDWNPLTVWFYKKCYLRFATQPYSLETLNRSVHLCNNSIQKHLTPSEQRHQSIPADNMWSDEQFRSFLSSQGHKGQWETVVAPRMKKAVIHTLQTTQDLMDSRKNTFELYGADFILGHDLHPWLIEINASPTMAPSTTVTARLCAAVQEDTLRVVLDRRTDRTADTGDFELIYRQAVVEVPHYVGINLIVTGKGFKMKKSCRLPPMKIAKRSLPKQYSKEETVAAEKIKPLPKIRVRLPLPVPTDTITLQVPWIKKEHRIPSSRLEFTIPNKCGQAATRASFSI